VGWRRYAAETVARLRRAGLFHARNFGATLALVQDRLCLGRYQELRYFRRRRALTARSRCCDELVGSLPHTGEVRNWGTLSSLRVNASLRPSLGCVRTSPGRSEEAVIQQGAQSRSSTIN